MRQIKVIIAVNLLVALMVSFSITTGAASAYLWPVPSVKQITSGQGFRPGHNGIDIPGTNKEVVSSASGTIKVLYSGCNNHNYLGTGITCISRGVCSPSKYGYYKSTGICNDLFGNGMIIYNSSDGTYMHYAHMNSIASGLVEGSTVSAGTVLGKTGDTGNALGGHLHFEIRTGSAWGTAQNPLNYVSMDSHTHSYVYYYESAHHSGLGHKEFMKCSCGDWYYTGGYITIENCDSCAKKVTIDDGYYRIVHNRSGKVVDFTSYSEGQNFTLFDSIPDNRGQIFEFKRVNSNEQKYKITNLATGRAASIDGHMNQIGAKIVQYTYTDRAENHWTIRQNEGGWYYLRNEKTGYYWDLNGGNYNNGDYFHQWTFNGGGAQGFRLEKVGTVRTTIDDGYYRIIHNASNKAVDTLWSYNNGDPFVIFNNESESRSQIYEFKRLNPYDHEKYSITNLATEKAMAISTQSGVEGEKIAQYPYSDVMEKQWFINDAGNGTYYLQNVYSRQFFDLNGGITTNGNHFVQYGFNGSAAQQFRLEKINPVLTIESDHYRIIHKKSGKAVDININAQENDSALFLNKKNGGRTQIFDICPIDSRLEGKFSITSYATKKAVGVDSHQSGAKIGQYAPTNSDEQRWRLIPSGHNAFYIRNEASGLYWDLYNADESDGNYFHQNEANYTDAQLFVLEKTMLFLDPPGKIPSVTTNKSTYNLGETVNIKWEKAENADYYSIEVFYADGEKSGESFWSTSDWIHSVPENGINIPDAIPPGKYRIVATPGRLMAYMAETKTETYFTVTNSPANNDPQQPDVDQDGSRQPDVNQDGFINATDVNTIRNVNNYNKPTTAAGVNPNADVNGDGFVNATDVNIVRNINNYNRSAKQHCVVGY